MSDRPMRLKYLTKMKIILCIFLLYITAVSVFGESQELNGVVGKSIEFPAAVKIDGSLSYSGVLIGDVTSGRFTAPRNVKFSGRVRWDSSTGLFSLSELKMEDIGEYKVQNTDQNIITVFQLNVYKGNVPVSKPHLSVTHNEYRCTVLCAAVRGTGATLTLYREGETNPYVTSPGHSHPDLDMTETVESGTYTCEAKNSVSKETSDPVIVEAHCNAPSSPSAGTIVASIIAAVAIFTAVVFAVLYWHEKRQAFIHAAVRRLILAEKLLDNIVAAVPALKRATQDEDRQAFIHGAFTRLIVVYEILEDIVAPAHVEEMQALLSNVINRLDILVAPGFDIRSLILDVEEQTVFFRDVEEQTVFLRDIRSIRRAIRTTILDVEEQTVFLRDIRSLILAIRTTILVMRSKQPGT